MGERALGDRQTDTEPAPRRALRSGADLSGRARSETSPHFRGETTRGCPVCPPRADPGAPAPRLRLRAFNTMDSEAGPGRAGPGEDGDRRAGTGDTGHGSGDRRTGGLGGTGPGPDGRPGAGAGQGGGCPAAPASRASPEPLGIPRARLGAALPGLGADSGSEPPPGTGPVQTVNLSVFLRVNLFRLFSFKSIKD